MSELPFNPRKLPEAGFQVPDVVGCVLGWRAWRVDMKVPDFETAPKMWSATFGYYWAPRRYAEAECDSCSADGGVGVPGEHHGCGFYSAKTLEHLMSMGYHEHGGVGQTVVVGMVANWGKVIEGTQGWRAQFSYPVRLWVPHAAWRLCKPLTRSYGVPCELRNTLRREHEDLADLLKEGDA
jgi:hypothetical protein